MPDTPLAEPPDRVSSGHTPLNVLFRRIGATGDAAHPAEPVTPEPESSDTSADAAAASSHPLAHEPKAGATLAEALFGPPPQKRTRRLLKRRKAPEATASPPSSEEAPALAIEPVPGVVSEPSPEPERGEAAPASEAGSVPETERPAAPEPTEAAQSVQPTLQAAGAGPVAETQTPPVLEPVAATTPDVVAVPTETRLVPRVRRRAPSSPTTPPPAWLVAPVLQLDVPDSPLGFGWGQPKTPSAPEAEHAAAPVAGLVQPEPETVAPEPAPAPATDVAAPEGSASLEAGAEAALIEPSAPDPATPEEPVAAAEKPTEAAEIAAPTTVTPVEVDYSALTLEEPVTAAPALTEGPVSSLQEAAVEPVPPVTAAAPTVEDPVVVAPETRVDTAPAVAEAPAAIESPVAPRAEEGAETPQSAAELLVTSPESTVDTVPPVVAATPAPEEPVAAPAPVASATEPATTESAATEPRRRGMTLAEHFGLPPRREALDRGLVQPGAAPAATPAPARADGAMPSVPAPASRSLAERRQTGTSRANRRQYRRVTLQAELEIDRSTCRLIDLSMSGFAAAGTPPVSSGGILPVVLRLSIDGIEISTKMNARIIYTQDARIGGRFVEVTASQMAFLRHLVSWRGDSTGPAATTTLLEAVISRPDREIPALVEPRRPSLLSRWIGRLFGRRGGEQSGLPALPARRKRDE